jgi:hypothetical protein
MMFPVNRSAVCVLGLVVPAFGGPDWTEGPTDAGKSTPQTVTLPIQPETISGTLGSPAPLRGMGDSDGGEDIADLYDIQIDVPDEFIATTVGLTLAAEVSVELPDGSRGPGVNNFDTALWLFRLDRRGLLGHNDVSSTDVRSRLLPIATDGTGARLPGPGRYLLAISYGDVFPVSMPAGTAFPIFSFTNAPGPTQVSGPDGQGGGGPLVTFVPDSPHPVVSYRIILKPRACPAGCHGDANGDSVVNFADVTTVLSAWGAGCRF